MNAYKTKSFARRISRALRDTQKRLLKDHLGNYEYREKHSYEKVMLEIGFGNGEHLEYFAQNNPHVLCIGAEPYLNGVATLLGKLVQNPCQNIRIHADDVHLLLEKESHLKLDYLYIICPDPWPKRKQMRRRLINQDFLLNIGSKMKMGGEMNIVTDHLGYAKWILEYLKCCGYVESENDLDSYIASDFLITKYQQKGIDFGSKIYKFIVYMK
jgi:tRNA (guanine-N7-)-methyltransferase